MIYSSSSSLSSSLDIFERLTRSKGFREYNIWRHSSCQPSHSGFTVWYCSHFLRWRHSSKPLKALKTAGLVNSLNGLRLRKHRTSSTHVLWKLFSINLCYLTAIRLIVELINWAFLSYQNDWNLPSRLVWLPLLEVEFLLTLRADGRSNSYYFKRFKADVV